MASRRSPESGCKPAQTAPHQADEPSATSLAERCLPWIVGAAGVLLFHRFTILSGFDLVQADIGDSRFIAFVLEHWNAVFQGRANWSSPPIFYPLTGTLAYSDALLAMGILHALLRHLGLGVFTAVNVQLTLLSAASYAACYFFLRRSLKFTVFACCAGAYFFAFGGPRFAQIVHEQLQFTAPLPILAYLFLVFVRDGLSFSGRRALGHLCAFVVLMVILLATTTYYALFLSLGLCLALALCLVTPESRRHVWLVVRRHRAPLATAALLLGLLIIPIAQIYLPVARLSGGRDWRELSGFLVDPPDVFWMGRENFAWGWFFEKFPARAERNWPEMRLGVGLVVTLVWVSAVAWAVRRLATLRPWGPDISAKDWRDAVPALIVIVGFLLQIAMLRLPHSLSLWWLAYKYFPGMNGVRAVSRLQLVVMLPMSVAIAYLADWLRRRWRQQPLIRCALALVPAIGLYEQLGSVWTYSGRSAESLAQRVADAIPAGCKAFYIVAPPEVVPADPPVELESAFDARSYLQANPDVAQNWTESAWTHYVRYGKSERRSVKPTTSLHYQKLKYFYAYTIPLAATLAGKSAVNGLSGWEPVGYDLGDSLALDSANRLKRWLSGKHVEPDVVCSIPLALDLSELQETEAK